MEIILYQAPSQKKEIIRLKKIFFQGKNLFFSKLIGFTFPSLKLLFRQKRFLRVLGYNFIALSMIVGLVVFGPIAGKEAAYQVKKIFSPLNPSPNAVPQLSENQKNQAANEAAQYDLTTDFSLVIPAINASAQVIANVNPGDEKEYKSALKKGVAHAAGTAFPGSKGIIYLFAHSTGSSASVARYNAIFYLLKELQENDEIIVFFAGQKFVYLVSQRLITEANDTQWLTKKSQEELLVLQTCWPPGTTQKRLIITAQPKID